MMYDTLQRLPTSKKQIFLPHQQFSQTEVLVEPRFGSTSLWYVYMMQQADAYNKQQTALKQQAQHAALPDQFLPQLSTPRIQPIQNGVRFGELMTLVAWSAAHPVLTWIASTIGQTAVDKGITALLSDINTRDIGLDSSSTFRLAKATMEHAKELNDPDVKKEYLIKAENQFIDAAGESPEMYKKCEYYKYAAVTAKMASRSPQTVLDLSKLAFRYRSEADTEIRSLNRNLEEFREREYGLTDHTLLKLFTSLGVITTGILTFGNEDAMKKVYNVRLKAREKTTVEVANAKHEIVKKYYNSQSDFNKICSNLKNQAEEAIAESTPNSISV